MEITKFQEVGYGNVIGRFNLLLSSGFELRELLVIKSGNGEFVSFPSRKYEAKDGTMKYAAFISIPDNSTYRQFQAECMKLLEPYLHKDEQPATAGKEDEIPF